MLKHMMKRCTFNNIVFTIISSLSCSYEHIVKHSLWYPTHRFMGWLRGAPPPKYGRSLMFGVGLLRNEVSGTRGSRKPCVSGTPGFPDTQGSPDTFVPGIRGFRKPCVSGNHEPDEKFPFCSECVTMFSSAYDLQRHTRMGFPMKEQSENDKSDDDNDKDGNSEDNKYGFIPLVNEE